MPRTVPPVGRREKRGMDLTRSRPGRRSWPPGPSVRKFRHGLFFFCAVRRT